MVFINQEYIDDNIGPYFLKEDSFINEDLTLTRNDQYFIITIPENTDLKNLNFNGQNFKITCAVNGEFTSEELQYFIVCEFNCTIENIKMEQKIQMLKWYGMIYNKSDILVKNCTCEVNSSGSENNYYYSGILYNLKNAEISYCNVGYEGNITPPDFPKTQLRKNAGGVCYHLGKSLTIYNCNFAGFINNHSAGICYSESSGLNTWNCFSHIQTKDLVNNPVCNNNSAGILYLKSGHVDLLWNCNSVGNCGNTSAGIVYFNPGTYGYIKNCYSDVLLIYGKLNSGIACSPNKNEETILIEKCFSLGKIETNYSGGIFSGYAFLSINNCYSNSYIKNCNYSGGLFYILRTADLNNCYYEGEIDTNSILTCAGIGVLNGEILTAYNFYVASDNFVVNAFFNLNETKTSYVNYYICKSSDWLNSEANKNLIGYPGTSPQIWYNFNSTNDNPYKLLCFYNEIEGNTELTQIKIDQYQYPVKLINPTSINTFITVVEALNFKLANFIFENSKFVIDGLNFENICDQEPTDALFKNIGHNTISFNNLIITYSLELKLENNGILVNSNGNDIVINNCRINANFSNIMTDSAGLLRNEGNASITNSSFYGTVYNNSGGICWNNGSVTLNNCYFEGELHSKSSGLLRNQVDASIINSSFYGKVYDNSGGICWNNGNVTLDNCYFEGEVYSKSAGLVYLNQDRNATINNCSFHALKVESYSGGALLSTNKGAVFKSISFSSIFIGTVTDNSGGVIWNNCDNFTITNLTNNSSGIIDNNSSGLIYNNPDRKITVKNCNFYGDISNYSGGICYNGGECEITDCFFYGNVSNYSGGICYSKGNVTLTSCGNSLLNNTYFNCTEFSGGLLYTYNTSSVQNCNSWFNVDNNSSGIVYTYDGSYCYISNTKSYSQYVKNNSAGICYNFGECEIYNCEFYENVINTSTDITGIYYDSAGICHNNGNVRKISTCTVNSNVTQYSSGIIFNKLQVNLIELCVLLGDLYGNSAGILNNFGNSSTINSCSFKGNIYNLGNISTSGGICVGNSFQRIDIIKCFSVAGENGGSIDSDYSAGIFASNIINPSGDHRCYIDTCYVSLNLIGNSSAGFTSTANNTVEIRNSYFCGKIQEDSNLKAMFCFFNSYSNDSFKLTINNIYSLPKGVLYINQTPYSLTPSLSNYYLCDGKWDRTTADKNLKGIPTTTTSVGSVWEFIDESTPYVLSSFNSNVYPTADNISSSSETEIYPEN